MPQLARVELKPITTSWTTIFHLKLTAMMVPDACETACNLYLLGSQRSQVLDDLTDFFIQYFQPYEACAPLKGDTPTANTAHPLLSKLTPNHKPARQSKPKTKHDPHVTKLIETPRSSYSCSNLQLPYWTWNDRHPHVITNTVTTCPPLPDLKAAIPKSQIHQFSFSPPDSQIDRTQPMEMETMSPISESLTTLPAANPVNPHPRFYHQL